MSQARQRSRSGPRGGGGTKEVLARLVRGRGYVSGPELSAALGISRAALWKRVNALRARGFRIEAVPGKGYRLVETPDLSAEEIALSVKGGLGKRIVLLEETGSTNDLAMGYAEGGSPHGTVVIADRQQRGRGRLGRKWASPPGTNIYMSVLLRPRIPPRQAPLLVLACAVACARAVEALTGLRVEIKWPNDLVVSGRKLGGILLETRSEPDRLVFAVAGIGINVNISPGALPPEVRALATSILKETGGPAKRTLLVAAILDALDEELRALEKGDRASLLRKWRDLSSTLGERVRVSTEKETVTGRAVDIDEEGGLIIETGDGVRKTIYSGDLQMLRKAVGGS